MADTDASCESKSGSAAGGDAPQHQDKEDVCEPRLALPQQKQRGKKRQWVSDTFQSMLGSVGGGGDNDSVEAVGTVEAAVKAKQGGDRETAQELERLLGEVSSYEGRLDNLLDLSSPIRISDDDSIPTDAGVDENDNSR